MSDQTTLRQKVREAIQAGKVPTGRPERTWGGRGAEACCVICSELIRRDEVEFELEFGQSHHNGNGGNGGNASSYHFHLPCFEAWELERPLGLPGASDGGRMVARECEPANKRGPA
jgi:hypothetical protein